MHTFIELWKPRPAWLALGADERQAYLDKVGPAIGQLLAAGVEIVGWGRIEDEPDGHTGILQLDCARDARGEPHVRGRAVRDAGARGTEARDLLLVEVDAVPEPALRTEPADALEVVHGAQAEALPAELLLVEGLGEVGVQPDPASRGELGAVRHDLPGH